MNEEWLIENLPEGWSYDCAFTHTVGPAFTITATDGQTLTIPLSILRDPREV
jgi:hypothetical protein